MTLFLPLTPIFRLTWATLSLRGIMRSSLLRESVRAPCPSHPPPNLTLRPSTTRWVYNSGLVRYTLLQSLSWCINCSHCQVDTETLVAHTHVLAEALARYLTNTTDETVTILSDHLVRTVHVVCAFLKAILLIFWLLMAPLLYRNTILLQIPNTRLMTQTISFLSSTPRAAPLIHKESAVLNTLEEVGYWFI